MTPSPSKKTGFFQELSEANHKGENVKGKAGQKKIFATPPYNGAIYTLVVYTLFPEKFQKVSTIPGK